MTKNLSLKCFSTWYPLYTCQLIHVPVHLLKDKITPCLRPRTVYSARLLHLDSSTTYLMACVRFQQHVLCVLTFICVLFHSKWKHEMILCSKAFRKNSAYICCNCLRWWVHDWYQVKFSNFISITQAAEGHGQKTSVTTTLCERCVKSKSTYFFLQFSIDLKDRR